MYKIIVNISRYIFLFYISIFLILSFLICLCEKNIVKINIKKYTLIQKLIILLFLITSFLILSFDDQIMHINYNDIIFFLVSIAFIVFANSMASFFYRKSCTLIWNGIFFIMSIGLVMLYRLNQHLALKQLVWFILGFAICMITPIVLSILPKLDYFRYIYLFLGLCLLLSTLYLGIENGGAKNWISIKGITFQPSEVVKILFIFYLSSCFSNENIKVRYLIFPSIMSLIFIVCLVSQVDLGSALIFFMTYLIMMYIGTSRVLLLFISIFLSCVGSFISYNLFNHVRVRFQIWINPWSDISDKGYQIAQSLFAIGTYGILGSGLNMGIPNTVPVVERDMIFSSICEEFGSLFGIELILIFIMIFFRFVKISLNSRNRFLSLVSSGLTSLLCFQSFLIIGGVTKFIPLTGVTLPFISYGGSSIIISFIIIGILQWISINNSKYMYNYNIL